jgi:PAS domain-containing protein
MRSTLLSGRHARLLYAGVGLFVALALFTARSIWTAWRERSGEAKAEAVFDLVGQRTPLRPTDAPGAMAWLRLELDKYARRLDPDRARRYRSFAAGGDRVPAELRHLLPAMALSPQAEADATRVRVLDAATTPAASLRRQRLVELDGHTLVVTRRHALDTDRGGESTGSDRFVRAVVPALVRAQADIARVIEQAALPPVPGDRGPRPVRVYAVAEDGTLVSAPWDDGAGGTRAAPLELALLGARPGVPTFAPEEFFFAFDPASNPEADGDVAERARYSGFYLDLGGRGLVSTLLRPIVVPSAAERGVIALDLAFDIDWRAVAASVEAPVAGAAVRSGDPNATSWPALEAAVGADSPLPLRKAVSELAARDQQNHGPVDPSPLRHGLVDGGAVAAFQVSDAAWLLMFFPKTSPAFPVTAVSLLAVMLAVLLAGFEFNRRRAEGERRGAERALAEKQNLLNTMQVPLVVVDPNTDVVVSSNRAAETIGVRAGQRFADLVWPDDRARDHYQRMQVASPEPRRAYGVPVGVRNEHGALIERYAIVRSVAVTAPIEALSADERHRLGVLFLLDPEADVALLADDISDRAHRDERRRLAGLLSHGVDTLARVLDHSLSQTAADAGQREFSAWLAEYLERRITVAAWLLDHWDATPPLPHDSVVDRTQLDATVARFDRILRHVRDDRELRARLHWNNGTLAAPAPDGAVLEVAVDWPVAFEFTCPIRGGFGWFLGEVVANAVRHGVPGTIPRLTVTCDRIRRELAFQVQNVTRHPAGRPAQGETYGGLSIMRALARLFEWRDLAFERRGDEFVASWRVPVSERGVVGQPD